MSHGSFSSEEAMNTVSRPPTVACFSKDPSPSCHLQLLKVHSETHRCCFPSQSQQQCGGNENLSPLPSDLARHSGDAGENPGASSSQCCDKVHPNRKGSSVPDQFMLADAILLQIATAPCNQGARFLGKESHRS